MIYDTIIRLIRDGDNAEAVRQIAALAVCNTLNRAPSVVNACLENAARFIESGWPDEAVQAVSKARFEYEMLHEHRMEAF